MKGRIFMSLCLGCGMLSAYGWGQKGHDTVAYIAQNHLTDATKQAVDTLLDGYSLTYWANWLDNASHTPEYEYTKTWHYKNINEDETFETANKIPEGNIVDALYEQVGVLQDPQATKDDKQLALKMVVHFLGDIHQPLHTGRATDRGGNNRTVYFFDRESNLHSIWDTSILEAGHKWSHTEWREEIDRLSPEQQYVLVANGNPDSWGKETFEICKEIYADTPPGSIVSFDYIAKWTPVIEQQLEKGGLRLADVLNSVFDSGYQPLNSFINGSK